MKEEATLELPVEEMRRLGYRVIDSLIHHYTSVGEQRVVRFLEREDTEKLLRESAPERGEDLVSVLEEFEAKVVPYTSHVDHPRMFAFIPGCGTFVGAMGDALASGYNIYAGTWVESSAAHQVELVVLDWFRDWLGLPDTAGGTLVSGGSVANLTSLVLARDQRLGAGHQDGVLYTSELAHSCVDRAARILGFGPQAVRKLPVDAGLGLDVAALEGALAEDRAAGRRPFCVVANAGDTGTGHVDPLPEIAEVCEREGLWLHVDAAYGGFAALDPRGRELLRGIERADSVVLDPHKWLYTPFEAGCLLVRDFQELYESFHILPDYLVDVAGGPQNVNMCDYGFQLSRVSRALKIWMAIKGFGLARFRAVIGRTLDLARYAQELLEVAPGVEIVSPAVLGIVTFRYKPAEVREAEGVADEERVERINQEILRRVWESGRAMISSTRVRGRYVLRLCVINHNTRRRDVEEVVGLIETLGAAVEAAES